MGTLPPSDTQKIKTKIKPKVKTKKVKKKEKKKDIIKLELPQVTSTDTTDTRDTRDTTIDENKYSLKLKNLIHSIKEKYTTLDNRIRFSWKK